MNKTSLSEPVNSVEEKSKIMEQALELAAENVGDVIPVVIERYYKRYPAGETAFREHGYDRHFRVAQEMVDSVLYCIVGWIDRQHEIQSIISDTVPHHRSLKIPSVLLESLLDVTHEVLRSGIPPEEAQAEQLLATVVQELREEIRAA